MCGEALIDFVPFEIEGAETAYAPKPGGSPYNVALAAARAGCKTFFLGSISKDLFGDALYGHLLDNAVDCSLTERSNHPTTLAFVDYLKGEPRYAFFNENSANINLNPHLPSPSPSGGIFHAGSISLIESPAAERIVSRALSLTDRLILTVDPNVRANLILDRQRWLAKIKTLFDAASVIKLSTEDLAFIDPAATPDQLALKVNTAARKLVIITSGQSGATAYHGDLKVTCEVPPVDVKDTVGAGDTLMGTVLAWLLDNEFSLPGDIARMNETDLDAMLKFGVTAAALNCTQSGCNPPYRSEIQNQISRGLDV